jgi:hypothetical protein
MGLEPNRLRIMESFSSDGEMVVAWDDRAKPRRRILKRYFLLSLLAATWIPLAYFILMAPREGTVGSLAGIKMVFLFLGTAHVPATLFFYTDKDFFGIIKSHRVRYIYVPLLLTVTTGLLFALLNQIGQAFLLLTYWAWQAFHYGRQNIGVYAFASIAQTGKAPQKSEKLAIDLGTILGIMGTFKILGATTARTFLQGSFEWLYQIGTFAFIALFVFSLAVYLRFFRTTTALKTLFFFTSVFFFLPVFISTDLNVAFLSYAMAHGLQYLIFMSVVSANSGHDQARAISYRSVLTLGILILVVGFAFWRVADLREFDVVKNHSAFTFAADFLFGAVLGATMSHFVIDASAWKLSLAAQRAYISKRFGFIFAKSSSSQVSS